jgi:nitroimidazol reductase NimA-like FMN-containing flavoprotein (pyridoxamine 5'-phosphate oxidase superfamily)
MPQRTLDVLLPDECYSLLGSERVGRLIYVDEAGPAAVPVNYSVIDHDIVFRVEQGSHVLRHFVLGVAFEVDHIDNAEASGWSVLLRGEAAAVEEEAVPGLIHATGGRFPRPWAAGVHNTWIRLTPRSVTGRRLAAPFSALIY